MFTLPSVTIPLIEETLLSLPLMFMCKLATLPVLVKLPSVLTLFKLMIVAEFVVNKSVSSAWLVKSTFEMLKVVESEPLLTLNML